MSQLPLDESLGHVLDDVLPPATRVSIDGRIARLTRGSDDDRAWAAGELALGDRRIVRFVGRHLLGLRAGMQASLTGVRVDDATYGVQLHVQDVAHARLPIDREGAVVYLAANVAGLGPKRAARLVELYGTGVIQQLLAEPALVRGVFPGLRGAALEEMVDRWATQVAHDTDLLDAESRLVAAGLGTTLARRAARFFPSPSAAAIVAGERPYRLLAVPGIGWSRADRVAKALGVKLDSPTRLSAAAEAAAIDLARDGHSCAVPKRLSAAMRPLVGDVDASALESAIETAEAGGRLVRDGERLYLPEAIEAEWRIADAVAALIARQVPMSIDERQHAADVIGERLHLGTARERPALSSAQQQAVWMAVKHGVSILTGRPGSGKTTTLHHFIRACAALGRSVVVAAPTGKAAARVTEVARVPAGTIHRLIGGPPGHRRDAFLDADVVIVDEMSMCGAETLAWLLMNVDVARTQVLLCGDPAQLPSVEHGAVLRDLLRVKSIPRVELTEVFRQATESRIIRNAHALLDGVPLDLRQRQGDFRFVPVGETGEDEADAVLMIHELRRVVSALATKLGAAVESQLQVLTPRRTGPLGTIALNETLQQDLNPHGLAGPTIANDHVVRVGDRVIQGRNDYGAIDGGLFNGEQGIVAAVSVADDSVTVRFSEERTVTLRGTQLAHLELAWAVTVHRAQGSEWNYVILAYHGLHEPMLDQAVLYTAITRAKRLFALVGSEIAVERTRARRPQHLHRMTGLPEQCAASGLILTDHH